MPVYAHLAGLAAAAMLQPSDLARVDQISSAKPVVPAAAPPPTSEVSPQLTLPAQGKVPAAQVGDRSRRVLPPQQLAPQHRSAQATASLSKRADGRPTAAERLTGHDRCDPKAQGEPERRCRHVIENRASEFRRSEAPELSPEQKISLEQAGVDRTGIDAATRQLATSGAASGSLDAQGVAAIVLTQPAQPSKKPEPELDPAQAEAAAAVNGLINQPPPK